MKTPHGTLHVYNIHMGTRYFERRHQVRSLLASKELHEHLAGPRVLVGDFNEWIKGLTTRMLSEKFEGLNLKRHIGKRRSYPGLVPFLHLDQIDFERPLYVESAELVRTRLATMASDHLPLAATFGWRTGEPGRAGDHSIFGSVPYVARGEWRAARGCSTSVRAKRAS